MGAGEGRESGGVVRAGAGFEVFQKMARFCRREKIPEVVVDHVRRCSGPGAEVEPDHGATMAERYSLQPMRHAHGTVPTDSSFGGTVISADPTPGVVHADDPWTVRGRNPDGHFSC